MPCIKGCEQKAGHMDVMSLRDLMGHKSLRTTQQHTRVSGEAVKKAFGQFDRGRGRDPPGGTRFQVPKWGSVRLYRSAANMLG